MSEEQFVEINGYKVPVDNVVLDDGQEAKNLSVTYGSGMVPFDFDAEGDEKDDQFDMLIEMNEVNDSPLHEIWSALTSPILPVIREKDGAIVYWLRCLNKTSWMEKHPIGLIRIVEHPERSPGTVIDQSKLPLLTGRKLMPESIPSLRD